MNSNLRAGNAGRVSPEVLACTPYVGITCLRDSVHGAAPCSLSSWTPDQQLAVYGVCGSSLLGRSHSNAVSYPTTLFSLTARFGTLQQRSCSPTKRLLWTRGPTIKATGFPVSWPSRPRPSWGEPLRVQSSPQQRRRGDADFGISRML